MYGLVRARDIRLEVSQFVLSQESTHVPRLSAPDASGGIKRSSRNLLTIEGDRVYGMEMSSVDKKALTGIDVP